MKQPKQFDTMTRNALKKVRVPTAAMLLAGSAAFKAFWDREKKFTAEDLVAHIYEEMIETAIAER